MPKFTTTVDLLVPVLLEIEAADEDAALLKLHEMPKRELLRLANTEEASIGILDGSEYIEEKE